MKTDIRIAEIFRETEKNNPGKSTEFLLEITRQSAIIQKFLPKKSDVGDVADALARATSKEKLIEEIKAKMARRKITGSEAATETGIDRSTFYEWLRGTSLPTDRAALLAQRWVDSKN